MAGFVRVAGVQFGGSSNGVGVYNGQNMQNAWDVNSPNTSGDGTIMGQGCVTNAVFIFLNTVAGTIQPTFDNDVKDNAPQVEA